MNGNSCARRDPRRQTTNRSDFQRHRTPRGVPEPALAAAVRQRRLPPPGEGLAGQPGTAGTAMNANFTFGGIRHVG
ncbi:MAG: hypothetical protein ACYDHY_15620 [Acidiferrobacterales bacterium]